MTARNEIRETFFQECDELLEALDDGLRELDQGDRDAPDTETVNAVFRAVHSIKGGAGAFALTDLVQFAHRFETALDGLRAGALTADATVLQVFFRANDRLVDLVAASRDGQDIEAAEEAEILAELDALITETGNDAEPPATIAFVPMGIDLGIDLEPAPASYRIRFTPEASLYSNGNDPSLLLRALADLGQVDATVDDSALPAFDDLRPGQSHLSWTLRLTTSEPEHVIHEVFEFAEGHCTLKIRPDLPDGPSDLPLPSAAPAEITAFASSRSPTAPAKLLPEAKAAATQRATVRVDLDRVDRLINVVGELVINQAMLSQCAQDAGIAAGDDFATGLEEFKQLSREIQESVMAIRAQPVKSLFQRMARIVREASAATGKSVRLVTEGDTTEVDKTVVERLADPLTHMVRNAVDHGLESAADRKAAGKPETGTVTLTAAHRSGRVLIEITDDGAGINREKVRQIAIDKGLISAEAEMSDAEIDNLLFMPGFSTADQVSDLSGRGVGMDVAKSSIQALGGRVSISSTPGRGSAFSISLPLTLAVLEGMVVDVAGQTMVVPLTAILETLRPAASSIHSLGTGDQVVSIRGAFVPIIDLAAAFGHRPAEDYNATRVLLLVEVDQRRTCALVVDAIHDQRQVVIKGLQDNYGQVPGVAAATILGDGQIALIIDPDAIFETAAQIQAAPPDRLRAAGR